MEADGLTGFVRLCDRSRFLLRGPDAFRYLNGQISNDLAKASDSHALPACVLTPKGKLCGLVLVWKCESGFIVETDASNAAPVQSRLEKYLIADDVEIETLPRASWIHVINPTRPPVGRTALRFGVQGIDVDTELASLPPSLLHLDAEELRIRMGCPAWGREATVERFPQEIGLADTHVDFHKGCYVGQEVVSRIHSVGKVNHMLRGIETSSDRLKPGHLLRSPTGGPSGEITSLRGSMGLALVKRDAAEPLEAFDESGCVLGEVRFRQLASA